MWERAGRKVLKNAWAWRRNKEEQVVRLLLLVQHFCLPAMQNHTELNEESPFSLQSLLWSLAFAQIHLLFHQPHQNLRAAARGPSGSFLLFKFFTPLLLPGVDFHSLWRMQPDPPRPLSTLSASATMKNYSACRPLFLLFPLLSSSSARKREFQDKLMDVLGQLKSGPRKMHQIL